MKKAVCNELFGSLGFRESCELLSEHGFEGVEIAPFTLFNDNGKFTSEKVRTIRDILDGTGISFAGFHWLFAKPEGLLMVSKDPKQRNKAWDHLRHLLEISGELGGGPLTFGSPVQRYAREVPPDQAVGFLREGLQNLCGMAGSCNSEVLIEALSSGDTNVINTLGEAEAFVKSVGCPSIQGMFDFHNCTDETLP